MEANNTQHSVQQWWLSLSVGIIYLVIGVMVLIYLSNFYIAPSILFISGFGITGLISIYYAISNREKLQHWGWVLMSGVIDLALMVLLLTQFSVALTALALYVGFVLMFRSIIGLGFSTYLSSNGVQNWGWVMCLSLLGIVFSFLVIWNPALDIMFLIIFMVTTFFAVGFAQIGIAYELRKHHKLFNPEQ